MNKINLKEYRNLVKKNTREKTQWRRGQNLFNSLSELNPELAISITGKSVDTYYRSDTESCKDFWKWLYKHSE